MPIPESRRRPSRDRWPLQFDLEGVPRDADIRQQLLEQKREIENSSEEEVMAKVTNTFAVDYKETVVDINNPGVKGYNPNHPDNQFPRMVYDHETGHTLKVQDAKQLKAAVKKGFSLEPSPTHDYSRLRAGRAAAKEHAAPRPQEMTVEELEELDAAAEAGEE